MAQGMFWYDTKPIINSSYADKLKKQLGFVSSFSTSHKMKGIEK